MGDVDWEHECLLVRQALDLPAADGTPRFKATKSHRGERPVSLPSQLVVQLREHRAAQLEARRAAVAWAPYDLVFTDEIGRPIWGNTLRRDYYHVLEEAALPRVMLHGLRHSMATLMLAAGEHPKVVSERMGHSSVAFTLATYSHVMPGMHEKAAQRLANALDAEAPHDVGLTVPQEGR